MITSFTQLTLSRENLLTEIQSLKQKVLTSSNQAMILKETEKKYWNQLIDSNIRVGTMACIWCIKTQFIKRMSMAFHRWRLNSTMISWVLLNKTTTHEEDGYGSINSDVDRSRLRRISSPSLTRLIPHKGITQKYNNLHDDDDDDDGVCDVVACEDYNDNGNNQDNGTITDAVQIALKIVDRYKSSSKSSPTKKKVTDIQSLLAYKDSSSIKLSPHDMKRKQLLDLSKRIANTSTVDSNTNNKSINNNNSSSTSNSNTNNNNDNKNRGTSSYINNINDNNNDNRNNYIDYSRNDINHNYFTHTLSSSLKANENSFHGNNSPSRRSSSKNRNIENKKKESDENDVRRSSNRSGSPSSSSSRTRKVTDSDHYRNNINYENIDNEFYHDSSDNNHTNHARRSINSNTSRNKNIILSSSSLSLFQTTSNKHLHNEESHYRNDRIGCSSSRENKSSSKSPPTSSSSSPLLHKSSPNNFITNDHHYYHHRQQQQQQQHHDETNSNYGSSCSNDNNDNYDSALENIRISNKNYFSHQNVHHHVSNNNDDNCDFHHDTSNDDDDDNNINNYSNKKDDNRDKNNFTNTSSIMNKKNNNDNNHNYHHNSSNINKSNYKNFPRYLQETRSTLIKNYTNKKKFPIAAATATIASNKNIDNISNDGKYHHSRVDDRDDSRNSRSDTRSSRSGSTRGSSISNHFDHVDRCSMSNNNTITHQYQQQEQQQRYPQNSASTSNSKSSSNSSNIVSQRSKMDKAQVRLIYGDLDDPLNGDIWTRTLRGNR